jgi:signal transduction histidine kinase
VDQPLQNSIKFTPEGGRVCVALRRSNGGNGLGLSIARKIVEMHMHRLSLGFYANRRGSEIVSRFR